MNRPPQSLFFVRGFERCLRRIEEEYDGDAENLLGNQTRQDAILLNLQRACETAIDLAMRLMRRERLGVPKSSREVFDLLARAGVIEVELATRMKGMVGFRNIALHEYQSLKMEVVRAIIETRLDDFRAFARAALPIP